MLCRRTPGRVRSAGRVRPGTRRAGRSGRTRRHPRQPAARAGQAASSRRAAFAPAWIRCCWRRFLEPPYGRFLDIGCGTGALSFLLLARDPAAAGVGPGAAAAAGGPGRRRGGRQPATALASRCGWATPARRSLARGQLRSGGDQPALPAGGPGRAAPRRGARRSPTTRSTSPCATGWIWPPPWCGPRPGWGWCSRRRARRSCWPGCAPAACSRCALRPVYPRRAAGRHPGAGREPPPERPAAARAEPPLVVHEGSGYSAEVRRMLGEES